jgi:hypothetical protein
MVFITDMTRSCGIYAFKDGKPAIISCATHETGLTSKYMSPALISAAAGAVIIFKSYPNACRSHF